MIGYPLDSQVTYEADGTPIYDRAISSAPLRKLINKLFSNGVMPNPSTNMQVVVGDSGMTVKVNAGFAIVNGCLKYEESQRTLEIQAASSTYDRIDTVVVRLNDEANARICDLYVRAGTPATNPVRPELTRSGSVYEIGLADIFIPKNTSTISQSRITDTRYETTRCGIISSISQFDTTTLYNQIQTDLSEFKTEEQQEFLEWFENLRYVLDGDVAGHLQNEIDDLEETVAELNDTLTPSKKKILLIGDSYGEGGSVGGTTYTPYATYASQYTGATINNNSESGAGFARVGDRNHNFKQLLSTYNGDKNAITDVYFMGGLNDRLAESQSISDAIRDAVSEAKTLYPNAKVSIGFIGWFAGSPDYDYIARARRSYKACTQRGASYMTNIEFVMHNFNYFDSDTMHPNDEGHKAIGRALASYILNGTVAVPEYARTAMSFTPSYSGLSFSGNLYQELNGNILTTSTSDAFTVAGFSLYGSHTWNGTEDFQLGTLSGTNYYGVGKDGIVGNFTAIFNVQNVGLRIGTVKLKLSGKILHAYISLVENGSYKVGTISDWSIDGLSISCNSATN